MNKKLVAIILLIVVVTTGFVGFMVKQSMEKERISVIWNCIKYSEPNKVRICVMNDSPTSSFNITRVELIYLPDNSGLFWIGNRSIESESAYCIRIIVVDDYYFSLLLEEDSKLEPQVRIEIETLKAIYIFENPVGYITKK